MRSDTVSLSSVPFQRPLIFFSSFPSFLPLSFTPLIMSFCLSHPLHRPSLSLLFSPSPSSVSLSLSLSLSLSPSLSLFSHPNHFSNFLSLSIPITSSFFFHFFLIL